MSAREHTAGGRTGPYPAEWGRPAGARDSDERRDWVASNIATRAGAQATRQLARRDARLLADLRRADLDRRRTEP